MHILTEDAQLACAHAFIGRVKNAPSQGWVRINGKKMLAEPDPIGSSGWTIDNCPNVTPGQFPCKLTLKNTAGYSSLIMIDGHPICLDSLSGLTNGQPEVRYSVVSPGQDWVNANS